MSENFERILNHKDGHKIRLTVGRPIQTVDGNGDWQCDYKIEGLGSAKIRQAVGGDQIQAIMLALIYISTTLYFSEEYSEGKIYWDGGVSPFDLGLPVAETVRADIEHIRENVEYFHNVIKCN